ncbi:hypothetical protein HJC23_006972 [Cyclotella cryptica]|uniref:Diatom pyrenoid component 2 domain-containing protein n=1 Tax=Cyclotella cryptica TaxID=29204 RepID=A0ABD3QMC6_9STRA
MKLVSSSPAVIVATLGTCAMWVLPTNAFSLNRLSASVSSSYKLHVKDSSNVVAHTKERVSLKLSNFCHPMQDDNERQDDSIPDSSRRSAILRFTAMVSTGFVLPDQNNVNCVAVADDESKVFKDDSAVNQYYLIDKQDPPEVMWTPMVNNMATTSTPDESDFMDPWDKFTPRIAPIDETAVSRAFATNASPPLTNEKYVKLQEVVNEAPPTAVAPLSKNDADPSTDHADFGSLFALSFPLMVLGGAAVTFAKGSNHSRDPSYTGTGSPRVKVVMVDNQPYGLDRGRRYYKGVDVTINDPIPESDIRRYCDASEPTITNECAQSIAGFLEDVSLGSSGGGQSERTASAIISYLDTLSSGSSNGAQSSRAVPQATGVAFSSYLQGLSEGSIPAPSSAESVAMYLDSLASKERTWVSQSEARIIELESSTDEKVAMELDKIVTYLVESDGVGFNENSRGNGLETHDMNGSARVTTNGNGYLESVHSSSDGAWSVDDSIGRGSLNRFGANGSRGRSTNGGYILNGEGQRSNSLPL